MPNHLGLVILVLKKGQVELMKPAEGRDPLLSLGVKKRIMSQAQLW